MVRLVLGLAMTVAALAIAGRRVHYLYRLISSGQAAPGRLDGIGQRAKDQLREVFGQRRLLKWSVPGAAHFLTFWGFIVLAATILEAYGALFDRDFAIPVIGHWALLGFLEDFFAVAVLVSLATFSVIRLRQSPARKAAVVTLLRLAHRRGLARALHDLQRDLDAAALPRRADQHRRLPVRRGAFASQAVAELLEPLGEDTNEVLETSGSCCRSRVVLGFLVLVVYSKHLHIFVAPLNVLTKREPNALGPLLPMMVDGKPIDFEDSTSWTRTPLRPRQGRGLHLEGDARLRDLHRVRPLPVAVPGVEHRQAAVAQAADHGPARPPLRQGRG